MAASTHRNWAFEDTISVFWDEFRWPRWTGARLIKVHLHSNSFGGGALKWPLKGGSRLIQVAAIAGLTVGLVCSLEIY